MAPVLCRFGWRKAFRMPLRTTIFKKYTDIKEAVEAGIELHAIHPGPEAKMMRDCKAFEGSGVADLPNDFFEDEKPKFIMVLPWIEKWIQGHEALIKEPEIKHSLDDSNVHCEIEFGSQYHPKNGPHRCGAFCCQDSHANVIID